MIIKSTHRSYHINTPNKGGLYINYNHWSSPVHFYKWMKEDSVLITQSFSKLGTKLVII